MPLDLNPVCSGCQTSESELWRRCESSSDEKYTCNACYLKGNKGTESTVKVDDGESATEARPSDEPENGSGDVQAGQNANTPAVQNQAPTANVTGIRKSTRNRKLNPILRQSSSNKGKSRRSIFKRCVYKSPSPELTHVVSSCVYFRGTYFQIGDIVSMEDVDGGTYYAQVRGFLQDQYCEKSAAFTWLIPTQLSPADRFDPATYILGPEEDYPHKLEAMQFVCHAPSDYFAPKSPYPMQQTFKDTSHWLSVT